MNGLKKLLGRPYTLTALVLGGLILTAWLGRGRFQPVIVGTQAPELVLRDLAGNEVSITDYRGKVVLLNVWATWCFPCRAEMPSMERLYRKYADQGFEILAVSVDVTVGEADLFGNPGGDVGEFAQSLGLTFPIFHDPKAHVARVYQTTGVPESFVIGKDGMIYQKIAASTTWDSQQHIQLIERLLMMD